MDKSAPSPSSAGFLVRSHMTTRRWQRCESWATARAGKPRRSPICKQHYLFSDRFGQPGNDKGKVEAPVRIGTPMWYSHRSRWTPPCTSDTIVEFHVFAEVTDAV